jgi:hypothetical protein
MTIKETVRQALTVLPGNRKFGMDDLDELLNTCPTCHTDQPCDTVTHHLLSRDQIKRALRDIPYVRRLADGRYVVKGRKVPPKVDITELS